MHSNSLAVGLISVALGALSSSALAASPSRVAPAPSTSSGGGAAADSLPSRPSPKTVYLTTAAELDALRISNPRHYARAMRVLASADEVCKPTAPKMLMLQFDAQSLQCIHSMVFTSYPPQRRLSFQLDDTVYIAMVFLKEELGRLDPVRSKP